MTESASKLVTRLLEIAVTECAEELVIHQLELAEATTLGIQRLGLAEIESVELEIHRLSSTCVHRPEYMAKILNHYFV